MVRGEPICIASPKHPRTHLPSRSPPLLLTSSLLPQESCFLLGAPLLGPALSASPYSPL